MFSGIPLEKKNPCGFWSLSRRIFWGLSRKISSWWFCGVSLGTPRGFFLAQGGDGRLCPFPHSPVYEMLKRNLTAAALSGRLVTNPFRKCCNNWVSTETQEQICGWRRNKLLSKALPSKSLGVCVFSVCQELFEWCGCQEKPNFGPKLNPERGWNIPSFIEIDLQSIEINLYWSLSIFSASELQLLALTSFCTLMVSKSC